MAPILPITAKLSVTLRLGLVNSGISALTGKRVKDDDESAIKEHLFFCNYLPDFENLSILATRNNDFKVALIESRPINRDRPTLNKNKQSLSLEVFYS